MSVYRKLIRLSPSLYAHGWFFITLCTQDKRSYFWAINEGNALLNDQGKIAEKNRLLIPQIYPNVELLEYVIMPNHLHGILLIHDSTNEAIDNRPYGVLSHIIKWYKQTVSKEIHQAGYQDFERQKSFYDHIIRNDSDLRRIQEYILANPYKRENDEYYA